jgi:hypothetical protein
VDWFGRSAACWLITPVLGCAASEAPRGLPRSAAAPVPSAPVAARPAPEPVTPEPAATEPTPLAATVPEPAAPIDDGCYVGIADAASALEALNEIAARCAGDMQPVVPDPLVVELGQEERRDLPFVVIEPGRCFRVVAAGDPGVRHLRVDVVDRADHPLDSFDANNRFAVVGPSGPVCVDEPGRYRAVARVRNGAGDVALQVFRTE